MNVIRQLHKSFHQFLKRTQISSAERHQKLFELIFAGYVVQLSNNKSPPLSTNRLDSRNTHNLRKGSMPSVPVGKATIITSQAGRTPEQLSVNSRTGSASSKGSFTKKGTEWLLWVYFFKSVTFSYQSTFGRAFLPTFNELAMINFVNNQRI